MTTRTDRLVGEVGPFSTETRVFFWLQCSDEKRTHVCVARTAAAAAAAAADTNDALLLLPGGGFHGGSHGLLWRDTAIAHTHVTFFFDFLPLDLVMINGRGWS